MPNPRDHNVIGGQSAGHQRDSRPSAGLRGIVYHACGGRFNVDTYTNRKSNRRQRQQGADPATACVGRRCEGCGQIAYYSDLATLATLERCYPGMTAGQALRKWQKSRKKAHALANAAQLPEDPAAYDQAELF